MGLLGLLVVIFAPVNDAGDWRIGVGRDLNEVEPSFFSGRQGLGTGKNSKLAAAIAYNS